MNHDSKIGEAEYKTSSLLRVGQHFPKIIIIVFQQSKRDLLCAHHCRESTVREAVKVKADGENNLLLHSRTKLRTAVGVNRKHWKFFSGFFF